MKKTHLGILTTMVLGLAFNTVESHAYTIDDRTWVLEGHSRSEAVADWVDVIGDEDVFGVYGIDVKNSGLTMQFDLYTNFSGEHHFFTQSDNTLYSYYMADFAIDADKDGFFELGVVLQDHDQMSIGEKPTAENLDVGLYSVTSWDKSAHFFEETGASTTGGIGYGEWWANDASTYGEPVVAVADATLLADLSVSRTTATGMQDPRYIYSFSFDTSHLNSTAIDVFWGGATCANDAIAGGTAPVPEPATMLLFGTGLMGLIGTGRKKYFS